MSPRARAYRRGQRLLPGAARLAAAAPVVALNLLASKLPCRWTDINTSVLLLQVGLQWGGFGQGREKCEAPAALCPWH